MHLLLPGRTYYGVIYVAAFARPDTSTRDRLGQLLQDKQIPESPDLSPPWESRP